MDDVRSWLAKSNLQRFEEIFESNGYDDLDVIAEINEADLDAMEITLPGHRKKILLRVQQLKEQAGHCEGPATKKQRQHDLANSTSTSPETQRNDYDPTETPGTPEGDHLKTEPTPDTPVDNSDVPEDESAISAAVEESTGKASGNQSFSGSPFASWVTGGKKLAFYPKAGQRGVKIFSEHELGNRKGLQKLRRFFFNLKAEEVCLNPTFLKWSVSEIHGLIDTCWTLKKTSLLKNEAERVEAAAAESGKKLKQNKQTVTNNVNRMLQSHKEVIALDEKVKEAKSSSKKIKLEKKLSQEMTELKTAQESLRKALEAKRAQLGTSIQYEQQSVDTSLLSKEDIESIITAMINDHVDTPKAGD